MSEVDWSRWLTEYDVAVASAKDSRKPILLQLHRDKCAQECCGSAIEPR